MTTFEELDLAVANASVPDLAPRGGVSSLLTYGEPDYPHYDMGFTARSATPLASNPRAGGVRLCEPSVLVYHHIGTRNGPLHSYSYLELTNGSGPGDFFVNEVGNYVCRLEQSKEVGGTKLRRPVWVSYSIIDLGSEEPKDCDVPIVNLGGTPPCIQLFCGKLKLHDVWEEDENG